MLEHQPDYDQVKARHEAWWHGEVIDRALVWITAPNGREGPPFPRKTHASHRERWFDTEYQLDCAEAWMSRTAYVGDSLPVWWPNLGPEVYTAFLGCPLEYTDTTSWAVPILDSWDKLDTVRFDPDNDYYLQTRRMTDAAIERGKGKFIVGYTDLHPGADGACAFRDPQRLCTDLLDYPDEVRELLRRVEEPFAMVFDTLARRLEETGNPVCSWLPCVSEGRVHIPSNDFWCMVSSRMAREFFLDITVQECRMADRSVFHLDGRTAIKHLDLLLEIPELHAIQPTIGAGDVFDDEWMGVIRRARAAGKSIHLAANWDMVSAIMAEFGPEGFLFTMGAASVDEAEAAVRRIERWDG